jgi:hypothetical protein
LDGFTKKPSLNFLGYRIGATFSLDSCAFSRKNLERIAQSP